jgi:hypothetical protein
MTDRRVQKGPWPTEVVEGDPLQVKGREVVPFVRVTRGVRRRATLRSDSLAGQGYGFVHMRPVAIVDKEGNGGRHQIRNETAWVIGWLALAALLIPWIATLLIYLSRRLDTKHSRRPSA